MDIAQSKSLWQAPMSIAFAIAAVKVVVYLFAGSNYGYFRDELYFLACADHLALGYPDHAPLSIFITWFSRTIFGDSLYAIHLLPTLAGVLKIILTGMIVREFGGRHVAMLIACLCVLMAPVYMSIDLLMSMNAYEPVFWMGCVLCYIRSIRRHDLRYWLMFGGFAGLGLMNKHSMVFFGIAFLAGLIATPDRKVFTSKYIWLAAVAALLLFLPNLVWQYENNWATLELLRNVQTSGKNVVLSPPQFLLQQVFTLLPFTAPVWVAGLWYLLFDRAGKRFRSIGIAYIVMLMLMIVLKAKDYYLVPIYPMMFAAGGVFWERLSLRFRGGKIVLYAYAGILVSTGLAALPFAAPILQVDNFLAYQKWIGITPSKTEVGHTGPLPQHFGDRFGWEEMTEKVANVYNSLSSADREKAAIWGGNYGEAGAIDHFGPRYGLPKAISGHQSYYLWGPHGFDGSVMIILGDQSQKSREKCDSIEERDEVSNPNAMGEEQFKILICRGLKAPLADMWPNLKHWN